MFRHKKHKYYYCFFFLKLIKSILKFCLYIIILAIEHYWNQSSTDNLTNKTQKLSFNWNMNWVNLSSFIFCCFLTLRKLFIFGKLMMICNCRRLNSLIGAFLIFWQFQSTEAGIAQAHWLCAKSGKDVPTEQRRKIHWGRFKIIVAKQNAKNLKQYFCGPGQKNTAERVQDRYLCGSLFCFSAANTIENYLKISFLTPYSYHLINFLNFTSNCGLKLDKTSQMS